MEVDMTTANPRRELTGDKRGRRGHETLSIKKLPTIALATALLSAPIVAATGTALAADQTDTMSDPPNYSSVPAGYYDYASSQIPGWDGYDPASSGGGSWGYNQSLHENK
jgi:hypothetical protein